MKLIKLIISVLTLSIFTTSFGNASSAYTGPDLSGESLTILGPWMAPEDESFRDVISIFENATGATVEYGGSDEFEQIINIDCQAGSPPDIAVFPQPGLAANIAATGCLKPLGPDVEISSKIIMLQLNLGLIYQLIKMKLALINFMVFFIELM